MFFLLIFSVPAIILACLIWLSFRKSNKPWLKPFFSHHDFQKELLASSAIGLFGSGWVSLFSIITRNYPNAVNSSTFLELWILGFGIIALVVSLFIRSYNIMVFSIVYNFVYLAVEIVKLGYDKFYFRTKPTGFVSPLATFALLWLLVNFVYFLGKILSNSKITARVGNSLRALTIGLNVTALGILSTSYVFNSGLTFFNGELFFTSWGQSIVAGLFLVLTVLSVIFHQKINLSISEIGLSLIPGWLLLTLTLFSSKNNNLNSYSNGGYLSGDTILWNVVTTVAYLSYVMYLVYKGKLSGEKWLYIYSIVLLVCAVLGKFIDTSINLGFNGIFLTIFGLLVMFIGGVLEFIRRNAKTN